MIDKTPYTPGMREVLKLSKAEAGRLGHDYIGPEHYLLGIIRKGDGLAIQTLMNLDVDLEDVKFDLERMIEWGKGPTVGLFAPNPAAKEVLETTKTVSKELKHGWVGTEHLLLGILRHRNNQACICLEHFQIEYDSTFKEVIEVIEGAASSKQSPMKQGNMDHLHLTGLQFFGFHGTEPWEKEIGRRFEVDVSLELDMTAPGQTDDLHKALDYRKVYTAAKDVLEKESHELIERVAWRVLEEMFGRFKQVRSVRVKVGKPEAPIGGLNRMVIADIFRDRKAFENAAAGPDQQD